MAKSTKKSNEVLIMQISIFVIMTLIFIFWVFNLKNIWQYQEGGSTNEVEEIKKIINEDPLNKEPINDFKDETGKIIEDLTESEKMTASSSEEIKRNNCPEWINCMPTVGEARPCQIPPGCEGITQIAY
ncbi:MAG: hypothetical protein PHH52_01325 [Patescibacteria group bacterium]|nr:hypothetical protein [Patescibacteria group bacterium]MDD3777999.1 hypothetical protein [Patescibacteria group bacterium]MDD3939144.1 hypothetical protein [Patescibacteria group bacterium]MDD4443686.1 hypothetical protein [Patescibacteria group bacterium]